MFSSVFTSFICRYESVLYGEDGVESMAYTIASGIQMMPALEVRKLSTCQSVVA